MRDDGMRCGVNDDDDDDLHIVSISNLQVDRAWSSVKMV